LPIFVEGRGDAARCEWSAREFGATAFFPEKIPGHAMADLCRRQWRVDEP
jgi:hypothetical protein